MIQNALHYCAVAFIFGSTVVAAERKETPIALKKSDDRSGLPSGAISGSEQGGKVIKRIVPKTEEAPSATVYTKEFRFLVAEATKSFQSRDYRGAIAFVDKADALMPPSAYTLNIRGAVAIEQRRFDEGRDLCLSALKIQPGFFQARFNLCEIPFNQGNYNLARSGFMVLYNELQKDDPTIELLVYRIFLTYLLEADTVHAKDWLEKLPFPSQTPAYQFANAAWERKHGRMAKWHEWLQSAEFIWPEMKRANFADVLVHLGWLNDRLAPVASVPSDDAVED